MARSGRVQTSPEAGLAEDLTWLSGLARRLVTDPALADDACQEAWLTATCGGSRGAGRAALVGSLRSAIFRLRRSERRRRDHEARAARPEGLPSTEEMLRAGEASQELWRHLRALPEPYRSTLLLRFGHGASTREIARQLDMEPDSVRWRVRKGLSMLRDSYAGEDGRRGLAPLVPLALLPSKPTALVSAATFTLGLGVTMGIKCIVAACVALIAGVWVLEGREPVSAERPAGKTTVQRPEGDVSLERLEAGTGAAVEPETQGRLAALEQPPAAEDLASPGIEPGVSTLAGRAVDETGAPVAFATVTVFQGEDWTVEDATGATGAFAVQCPVQTAKVVVATIRSTGLHVPATVRIGSDYNCRCAGLDVPYVDLGDVVLAPGGGLRGRVVDGRGVPIEGAELLGESRRVLARSGSDGRIEVGGLKRDVHNAMLSATGYLARPIALSIQLGEVMDLGEIDLEEAPSVTGIVRDVEGRPIEGAEVFRVEAPSDFGQGDPIPRTERATTDREGRYVLALDRLGVQHLCATADGHRPALAVEFEPGAQVDLELGLLGETCRFRVVDAATGAPLPGARLRLEERERGGREPLGQRLPREHPALEDGEVASGLELEGMPRVDGYSAWAPGYHRKEGTVRRSATRAKGQTIELDPLVTHVFIGRILDRGIPVPLVEVEVQSLDVLRFGPDSLTEWRALPDVPEAAARANAVGKRNPTELDELDTHHLFTKDFARPARTNADGAFELTTPSVEPMRAVARLSDGRVAVSRVVIADGKGGTVDMGDLEMLELGSISGKINTTNPETLRGGHVRFTGRPLAGESSMARIGEDGSFELPSMTPGGYVLWVENCAAEDELGGEHFFVRVESGETREVELTITETLGTVTVSVKLNGAPVRNFGVFFDDSDKAGYDFAGGTETVNGVARCALDVGRRYSANVDLSGDQELALSSSSARVTVFDGIYLETGQEFSLAGAGAHWDIELESAAIELDLPRALLPEGDCVPVLRWRTEDGVSRTPLRAESTISPDRRVGADEGGDTVLARFPIVPVGARNLEMEIEGVWGGDTEVRRWALEAKLKAGGVAKATLRP